MIYEILIEFSMVIIFFYYLYKKINKLKNSWVPMNTHGYLNNYIIGTHEGTERARVSYLSNGAGTNIILSVPIHIPRLYPLIVLLKNNILHSLSLPLKRAVH